MLRTAAVAFGALDMLQDVHPPTRELPACRRTITDHRVYRRSGPGRL